MLPKAYMAMFALSVCLPVGRGQTIDFVCSATDCTRIKSKSSPPPACTASVGLADRHALAVQPRHCLVSASGFEAVVHAALVAPPAKQRLEQLSWSLILLSDGWRLQEANASAASRRRTEEGCCRLLPRNAMRLVRHGVLRLDVEGAGLVQGLAEVQAQQVDGEARQDWHLQQSRWRQQGKIFERSKLGVRNI